MSSNNEQFGTGVEQQERLDDAPETKEEVRIADTRQHEELYEKKLPTAYQWGEVREAFVRGILREIGKNYRFAAGRTLDSRPMVEEEHGALLVYPDETRVFVDRDETAHTRGDYGFAVQPDDPLPMPTTVDEALNLLKPLGVQAHLQGEGELPPRQGEWWLLEADEEPESQVFKPGVSTRPFGPSPLENHVPREYAFGKAAGEVLSWLESEYPSMVTEGDGLVDVLGRLFKASQIEEFDDVEAQYERPSFHELREAAGGVFVRGTLRHREEDHYMEKIGEAWKLARTHEMTVYTADNTSAAQVRRD